MIRRIAALAALTLTFATTPLFARDAKVQWVIDGDTFQTTEGERVRLLGVNCPEYQPPKQKEQPFGREASLYSRKILAGQLVRLETDVEKLDKYGRTLAYVYLEDGRFVNRLLVEQGLAKARYYKPNGKHRAELSAAEKAAKKAKKGLWATSAAG